MEQCSPVQGDGTSPYSARGNIMTATCQASPAATGTAFRTKREARYEARADNNRSRFGDVAGRRTSRHEHIRWHDDQLDHRHVDRLIHSHDDRRYLRRGNDRDVCNVSTGPNNAGYGTNAGAAATSAGITTPSPAIPTCSNFPPADELCN